MVKLRLEVRTYTLPGEETLLENFLNEPGTIVIHKVYSPCPKEGIILCMVERENNNEED